MKASHELDAGDRLLKHAVITRSAQYAPASRRLPATLAEATIDAHPGCWVRLPAALAVFGQASAVEEASAAFGQQKLR